MASAEQEWTERTKNILKAELKRRGIGYDALAERLSQMGVEENARNIANKISRGGFSATFLLQCLHAIGCRSLILETENESR